MTGIDPTLFLAVADLEGKPLDEPYFVALDVTRGFVSRARRLARLCDTHGIASLATADCDTRPHWHVNEDVMTEQTTTYHFVGTCIYLELSARRRVFGGYGELEVIGQSSAFDLAELVHMRKQRIVVDFRDSGDDDIDGEPFAVEVIRRLRCAGMSPKLDAVAELGDEAP